jgi:hypothetical protein
MAYYLVKRVSGNHFIVVADSEEDARKRAAEESGSEHSTDEILEVVYLSILPNPDEI